MKLLICQRSFKLMLLVLLALPCSLFAESPEVYVVDMEKAVSQSKVGKAARSYVEMRVKETKKKLEQEKLEFDRARADLSKQVAILSDSARKEKEEALRNRQREIQRTAEDKQEEIMRESNRRMQKILTSVDEIVAELAKKNKYQFVFEKDKRFVLFASKRVDITDEVIELLNKKKISF